MKNKFLYLLLSAFIACNFSCSSSDDDEEIVPPPTPEEEEKPEPPAPPVEDGDDIPAYDYVTVVLTEADA